MPSKNRIYIAVSICVIVALLVALIIVVVEKPSSTSPQPQPPSPFVVESSLSSTQFPTRTAFVDTVATLQDAKTGTVVMAGGNAYRKVDSADILPGLPDWIPLNDVWVEHFGAVVVYGRANSNKSKLDNTLAIQSAIDYAISLSTAPLYFRGGYYRVTNTLMVNGRDASLIGYGGQSTYLFADHTAGPVLHVTNQMTQIKMMGINASDARRDSGALVVMPNGSINVGILYESLDNAGRLQSSILDASNIQNQPSHALYISQSAFTGSVSNCWMVNNKGHGVLIDMATASTTSGLFEFGVGGLVSFRECEIKNNGGNAFALGNPSDMNNTTQALRVEITNCELADNASSDVARFAPAHVYMHGVSDVLVKTNVLTSASVPGSVGVFIAGGRNIHIVNNRFIKLTHAIIIDTYVVFPTIGVYIEGFNVINSVDLDDAVVVQNTTGNPAADPSGIVVNNYNYSGGINTMVTTGDGMSGGKWRIPMLSMGPRTLTLVKHDIQSVTQTTVVEDTSLKFWVTANETKVFSMVIGYIGASLKLRMAAPANAQLTFGPASGVKLDTTGTIVAQSTVGAGVDMTFGGTVDTTTRVLKLTGAIQNGSTAGVVVLLWAQASASNIPTQVMPNISHVVVHHVAD